MGMRSSAITTSRPSMGSGTCSQTAAAGSFLTIKLLSQTLTPPYFTLRKKKYFLSPPSHPEFRKNYRFWSSALKNWRSTDKKTFWFLLRAKCLPKNLSRPKTSCCWSWATDSSSFFGAGTQWLCEDTNGSAGELTEKRGKDHWWENNTQQKLRGEWQKWGSS